MNLIFILTLSISLLSFSVDARLYKWVDENGNTRYGDRLPPGYYNKKHQQLDAQGRVILTKEDAKTEAQLKAERAKKEEAERQKKEQEQARLKQQAEDRILLLTFNSEEEIFISRDQRLEVIDSKIALLEKSVQSNQKKLEILDQEATDKYRSKEVEIPGSLMQKIEQTGKNILTAEEKIFLSQQKRKEVLNTFEHDLKRFRDLKRRQRENQQ